MVAARTVREYYIQFSCLIQLCPRRTSTIHKAPQNAFVTTDIQLRTAHITDQDIHVILHQSTIYLERSYHKTAISY